VRRRPSCDSPKSREQEKKSAQRADK